MTEHTKATNTPIFSLFPRPENSPSHRDISVNPDFIQNQIEELRRDAFNRNHALVNDEIAENIKKLRVLIAENNVTDIEQLSDIYDSIKTIYNALGRGDRHEKEKRVRQSCQEMMDWISALIPTSRIRSQSVISCDEGKSVAAPL